MTNRTMLTVEPMVHIIRHRHIEQGGLGNSCFSPSQAWKSPGPSCAGLRFCGLYPRLVETWEIQCM